jgi:hypothetical protein
MGLIQAAGTEPEFAWDEPETDAVRTVSSIGSHCDLLRQSALPVGAQAFNAVALFAPVFRVGFDVSSEFVILIIPANRSQISSNIAIRVRDRRVIDVSGQKAKPVGILGFGNDMDFVAAFTAEPRRI